MTMVLMYCLVCKQKTETDCLQLVQQGYRVGVSGKCGECGSKKSEYQNQEMSRPEEPVTHQAVNGNSESVFQPYQSYQKLVKALPKPTTSPEVKVIYRRVLNKNLTKLKNDLTPCTIDSIIEAEIGSAGHHIDIKDLKDKTRERNEKIVDLIMKQGFEEGYKKFKVILWETKQISLLKDLEETEKELLEEGCSEVTDETVDMATGPIDQEHINQARLCNVIVTVCAEALRDILLSHPRIPYTNIYSTLLGSRATIAAMKRSMLIGQAQFKLIFPDPKAKYTGTVDQFDITLLYTLIRNISSCPPPATGWGKKPTDQPRDVSLSANVERIRLIRNKVSGHSVDGKLDDQICEDYMGEISEILDDVEAVLGDKGYKDALEERRKQIITPKEAKALRGQFKRYQQQLKEKMKAAEEAMKQLSTAINQNL